MYPDFLALLLKMGYGFFPHEDFHSQSNMRKELTGRVMCTGYIK